MATKRKAAKQTKNASGAPGAGAGRKDRVGPTGVYPMSGPHPAGDAPMIWPGSWGQGKRGAAGYEDHGESELSIPRVIPERCRDIMTKDPAFCQASDSTVIAAELMLKHNIGAIPVVRNLHDNVVVGIVTDRDLAMKVVARGHDPKKTTVRDVMTSPVITCSPDDKYERALELMVRHRVKRIPAVDNRGRAVGMISQADIALRIPDAGKIEEVVQSIVQPN